MPKDNRNQEAQSASTVAYSGGMSKREYFAGQAMAGLCSAHEMDGTWAHDAECVAERALAYADALLALLDV